MHVISLHRSKYIAALTLALGLAAGVSSPAFGQGWLANLNLDSASSRNYYKIEKAFEAFWAKQEASAPHVESVGGAKEGEDEDEGGLLQQFHRWQYYWRFRVNPDGSFPDVQAQVEAAKPFRSSAQENSGKPGGLLHTEATPAQWTALGPIKLHPTDGRSDLAGLGRLNAVRIVPGQPQHVFVCSGSGGLWESVTGGQFWSKIEIPGYPNGGASDIGIAPSDPNTMYLATGDADGGFYPSYGILKTTDAGLDWQLLPLDAYEIHRIVVHPTDPKTFYAATRNGVYWTHDGGNSWGHYSSGDYHDVVLSPGNPLSVTATGLINVGGVSTAQVSHSNDGGQTWSIAATWPSVTRVALAVTPASPKAAYACAVNTSGGFSAMYASNDGGGQWALIYNYTNILKNGDSVDWSGQGTYDLGFAVSPIDENYIVAAGINIFRTTDEGLSWANCSPGVHPDQHMVQFSEDGRTIWVSDDGGLFKTLDSGKHWTVLTNGINITEYYSMACSRKGPVVVLGGTQDNGTNRYDQLTWDQVGGGDGEDCAIDHGNSAFGYWSYYNSNIYSMGPKLGVNKHISDTLQANDGQFWLTPMAISPMNSGTLFCGMHDVWRTRDSGKTWSKLTFFGSTDQIQFIAVAPSNEAVIYAASPKNNVQYIWRSTDSGKTWVTVLQTPGGNNSNPTISALTVDPLDPMHCWATRAGSNAAVRVSELHGATWSDYSSGLPNVPLVSIAAQSGSNKRVFLASDNGVFVRDSKMSRWMPFLSGLPLVNVSKIDVDDVNLKVRVATWGRGIWEAPLPNCSLFLQTSPNGTSTICKGDSLRIDAPKGYTNYAWSTGDTSQSITVHSAGKYDVTVCDVNGCAASAAALTVLIDTLTPPTVKQIADTLVCTSTASRFQWNQGGAPIVGATNKLFGPDSMGDFTLTVWDIHGCSTTSNIIHYVPQAPSLVAASSNTQSVRVYPSPGKGLYMVDMEMMQAAKVSLRVVDATGKSLFDWSGAVSSNTLELPIDITRQPAGEYWVEVLCGGERNVVKIVKE